MKPMYINRPLMMDVFHPQFVNKFLNGIFEENGSVAQRETVFKPEAEVHHREASIVIKVAIYGVKKEDLKIDLENKTLLISGERKREGEDENRIYSEMAYGKFSRAFALKDDVETDKISAELKDGLLTISLPLKEKQGSKSIEIQ